ncbi:hypothetical protein QBC32DRAFT_58272 [Pseudoneurospora amorphoporcata]|uniref:Uncharacterized protein n=1 Tax=Pseudoneurospora amorphoporcata TaxID=241081 RepID=A0AAN6NMA6_9PEZI|nr:hypothetical protein QBC32DRAFT_58272 [Pseudoneurospora amorphoporcata]
MKVQLAFLLTALSTVSAGPCQAATTTTTTTAPSITTIAPSCTFTGTQTKWATSGCDIPCNTSAFCIYDAAVTKSCGCSSVPIRVTTVTLCPTGTPCMQCTTAWGTFTYTQPCTATATP